MEKGGNVRKRCTHIFRQKNALKDIILNTKNEIFGEISQLPKSKGKTQNGKFVQFAKNFDENVTKYIYCCKLKPKVL